MGILLLIIFLRFLVAKAFQSSNPNTVENDVTLSLMSKLGIKQCIIIHDNSKDIAIFKDLKYFANKNIYSTHMDLQDFVNYILMRINLNYKIAILMKSDLMVNIFNQMYTAKIITDWFLIPYVWILFDDPSNKLANQLTKGFIPYDREFFVIVPINDSYYQIDDMYNVDLYTNSHKVRHHLGFWSKGELSMTSLAKEKRRFDRLGETVIVTTEDPCEIEECIEKAFEFILYEIGNMMNSSTKFYWKDNVPQELRINVAALALPLPFDFRYADTRYLLGPVLSYKIHFYIKDNLAEEDSISSYFAPFSKSVWYYIIYILIASFFASLVIERLGWPKSKTGKSIILSLNNAMLPLDTLCSQSGSDISHNASSRLTWFSYQIAASILAPAYSAFIISYLTVSIPKFPFTDFETFVQDGTYKTSGINNTYSHVFLEEYSNALGKEIIEKHLLADPPHNKSEAIRWICKSDMKYAFLWYDKGVADLPNNECKIVKIQTPIFEFLTGIDMLPSYLKIYKINLHRFYENGLVQVMRQLRSGKKYVPYKEDYVSITLDRIWLLIFVISSGNMVASAILLLEIILNKKRQPDQRILHHSISACSF